MDNIFLKDYFDTPQDLVAYLSDVEKNLVEQSQKLENKIFIDLSLTGCITGLILSLCIKTPTSMPLPVFIVIFTLLGFLSSSILCLGLVTFKRFFPSMKKLSRKKENVIQYLEQSLEKEKFQKEFIQFLINLENSKYVSPEDKFFITKFKIDLLESLSWNHFKEASVNITSNIRHLFHIYEENKKYQEKEHSAQSYLKNYIGINDSQDSFLEKKMVAAFHSKGSLNYKQHV